MSVAVLEIHLYLGNYDWSDVEMPYKQFFMKYYLQASIITENFTFLVKLCNEGRFIY